MSLKKKKKDFKEIEMCLDKIIFMISANPEIQDSKDSVKEIQEHFIVFNQHVSN